MDSNKYRDMSDSTDNNLLRITEQRVLRPGSNITNTSSLFRSPEQASSTTDPNWAKIQVDGIFRTLQLDNTRLPKDSISKHVGWREIHNDSNYSETLPEISQMTPIQQSTYNTSYHLKYADSFLRQLQKKLLEYDEKNIEDYIPMLRELRKQFNRIQQTFALFPTESSNAQNPLDKHLDDIAEFYDQWQKHEKTLQQSDQSSHTTQIQTKYPVYDTQKSKIYHFPIAISENPYRRFAYMKADGTLYFSDTDNDSRYPTADQQFLRLSRETDSDSQMRLLTYKEIAHIEERNQYSEKSIHEQKLNMDQLKQTAIEREEWAKDVRTHPEKYAKEIEDSDRIFDERYDTTYEEVTNWDDHLYIEQCMDGDKAPELVKTALGDPKNFFYCKSRIIEDENDEDSYQIFHDIKHGRHAVFTADRREDEKYKIEGTKALPVSEIIFQQRKRIIEEEIKKGNTELTANNELIEIMSIYPNDKTKDTLFPLTPENSIKEFTKQNKMGYYLSLSTPNGKYKFFLPEQHKNFYGNKEINSFEAARTDSADAYTLAYLRAFIRNSNS